jgi:ubiquinone/menaquinone biosynthesis C-methylase UbiE
MLGSPEAPQPADEKPLMSDADSRDLTADNRKIWETNPPTFVDRRVETILELLPRLGPEASLLDVGCLEGSYTRMYADAVGAGSVHGIDVSLTDTARAKGIEAVEFDLNSGARLPYADGEFDVVVCIESLEHIYPTDFMLGEIRRVLKPGGTAVIDVPRLDSLLNIILLTLGFQPPGIECSRNRRYGSINDDSVLTGHVAYFTRRALLAMLEDAGFGIVEARQVGQRSGWLMLQEAEGRRVGAAVRFAWWLYDVCSPKKEYLVVKVTRGE